VLADMYSLSVLKARCEERVVAFGIDESNVVAILCLAHRYHCTALRRLCMHHVVAQFSTVVNSPSYAQLKEDAELLQDVLLEKERDLVARSAAETAPIFFDAPVSPRSWSESRGSAWSSTMLPSPRPFVPGLYGRPFFTLPPPAWPSAHGPAVGAVAAAVPAPPSAAPGPPPPPLPPPLPPALPPGLPPTTLAPPPVVAAADGPVDNGAAPAPPAVPGSGGGGGGGGAGSPARGGPASRH
jgi:hypothetical protein